MPGVDGVEATRRIRELHPPERTRIIILTTFEQDGAGTRRASGRRNGFLSKAVGPAELITGVEEVAAGGGALSAAASAALIGHVSEQPSVTVDEEMAGKFADLTPKEREVVVAIASGLDDAQIAGAMFLLALHGEDAPESGDDEGGREGSGPGGGVRVPGGYRALDLLRSQ